MRYSRQRESVYEALCSTRIHPDANWVYNEVRKVMPCISRGTVYRNLSELCALGKVKRVSVNGDREHYDADVHPHSHLVCTCCGAISDADNAEVHINTQDFEVDSVEIVIYGKCKNCR